MQKVKLGDICEKGSSNIAQKDVENNSGNYPIYGAAGLIKYVDFYQQEKEYIAVVKDGAGIGRAMKLPAKSSVIGTMQYIFPKENVYIDYLFYLLSHLNLAKYFSGATIPHIYFKDYKNEEVKLPPLEEQKAIAEKLDKVSILIEKRKQQLSQLDFLVKSQFIELFGNPEYNTKGFPLHKLGDLCNVGSSKRIYQDEQTADGIPFLRISDLNNKIDGKEVSLDLFIPEKLYESLKDAGLVPIAGDILVTARGTLGRCYIIKESDVFYFQDGMITWLSELNDKVTNLYISHLFNTEGMKKQIAGLQAGSTVAYLSIAMTKKLNVMLPPVGLQNEFARFVEQTDKSKFRVKQSLAALELLKKSLMQKYFG